MCRLMMIFSFLLLLAAPFYAAEKPSQTMRVADYLAVFDLEIAGKADPGLARPLSESIRHEIAKSAKFKVVDRANMEKILKEQAFQMTGCVAKACAVEAGQLLGVGKVIIGSLGLVGKTYYLTLSQVNVETGETEQMAEQKCRCEEDELIDSVKMAARRLMGEAAPEAPAVTTTGMGTTTPVSITPAAKTYRDPTTGMEFVLVKGGCYQMGDTFGDEIPAERPVHEVCVDDFYLGRYEVTVGQFREFVNATGYRTEAEKGDGDYWRNPGFSQTDRHPVVCVSYNDALAFIEWLSRTTGKTYRLPTEAEWEYAARSGGKKYKYSWGHARPSGNIADLSLRREWSKVDRSFWDVWEGYNDGYVFTAPVGSFSPNELGLYDMTGNVWEWCYDWYGEKYYEESRRTNPPGPDSGEDHVIRGGSWADGRGMVRASQRNSREPWYAYSNIGFRVVLSAL